MTRPPGATPARPGVPGARAAALQRRWTAGDLLVLRTLVASGESLAGLATRLRRPRPAILCKCRELALTLDDQADPPRRSIP